MRLDAKRGILGDWIDLKTGQRIKHVRWGDPDTGEYEALVCNESGTPMRDNRNRPLTVKRKTLLQFKPKTLTDELKLKALVAETGGRVAVLKNPLPADQYRGPSRGWGVRINDPNAPECEHPGCHKKSEWRTMDEHEVEAAVLASGRMFQRALQSKFHWFCSKHYRWPIFTSLRGVESEVTTILARPQ